jgi:hypothetical protein
MAPRFLLLCPLALVMAGCGEDEQPAGRSGGGPLARLVVRVDADGPRGPGAPKELRLRCVSPGDSAACAAAARLEPGDFAPTPRATACTEIYGGPQTARVSGVLRGVPVSGRFARTNGCEIARWDAVARLLERVR